MVWSHGKKNLQKFQQHLNNQHPSIVFTMEEESEGRIPFLDVMVNRTKNKTRAQTSVYRKPTHTDRYINYNSNHPKIVLRATLCNMRDRANNICSCETKKDEPMHLVGVFSSNDYPRNLVVRMMKRTPQIKMRKEEEDRERPKMLYLPYIQGVSERIARGCRVLGIRTVFISRQTLRHTLTHVKSTTLDDKKQGVVYEVPCKDCEAVYIGETGRNLQERIKEHKYAVKRKDENNGIAVTRLV